MIDIPENIKNLRPYKAGKPIEELAREKNLSRIVKLASNENPLGASPKALEAVENACSGLHRYVDPGATELVAALAGKHNRKPGQIICGHGSDSLLADLINAFTVEGDEVLTSEGTFIGIYVSTNKLGRKLKLIPLESYAYDLKGIAAAVTSATRIIYLANPNNPTGMMFTAEQFERFMKGIPDNVLVILDEAYAAYAAVNPDYPNGLDYDYDNLVVVRTLSKVYGLAGLRVGFAVGPEWLIGQLYKVRLPFEPNRLAQVAATAALDDDEFLTQTIEANQKSLKQISDKLDALGISYLQSAANFVMLVLKDENTAAAFFEECLNRGLIVRHVNTFGVPNGVRINSGTEDETAFALSVIEEVYSILA